MNCFKHWFSVSPPQRQWFISNSGWGVVADFLGEVGDLETVMEALEVLMAFLGLRVEIGAVSDG